MAPFRVLPGRQHDSSRAKDRGIHLEHRRPRPAGSRLAPLLAGTVVDTAGIAATVLPPSAMALTGAIIAAFTAAS
jgi:hypothetical protein